MQSLELYHGGEKVVRNPRLVSPRLNRPLDFGQGFYATTSHAQAVRWVGMRIRQRAYASGRVSRYAFDQDAAKRLNVLRFHGADETWFRFVMANRHERDFTHGHDIVWGPVADDNVYETLTLFEDGIISMSEAIVRLKAFNLVDQLLFHTAAALECLRFLGSEECRT